MSKYRKLTLHLAKLDRDEWHARFEEVEIVLGFRLCNSADRYPAWWANDATSEYRHSAAWQSIGWRTKDLNLAKRQVTFFRQCPEFDKRKTPSLGIRR